MKIAAIGGTGLIGSKTIKILQERGHDAIAASPNSGVNTVTGEGLAAVLAGADMVIDVANSPSFADGDVLAMADYATGAPLNGAAEIAGPEAFPLSELVQQCLVSIGDPRKVQADAGARYFGALLGERTLVAAGKARLGTSTIQNWLQKK
jgi:uncharacterized protein YbjT (DUF2867 family)